jgi:hypothetical protein
LLVGIIESELKAEEWSEQCDFKGEELEGEREE